MTRIQRPRYILLGNPENRRVEMFRAELEQAAYPEPTVVAHLSVLLDANALLALPDEPRVVRIDSLGEDFAVEKHLLGLGYEAAAAEGVSTITPEALETLEPDRGRILCPRQQHLGFLVYLDRLQEAFAQHPSWVLTTSLADLRELFDKRVTSRKYQALGVPVPEFLENIDSPEALIEHMSSHEISSVFVKVASMSSASCLAIVTVRPQGVSLMTTIELTPRAWYNSLRVRRYSNPAEVDAVLRFLISEGSQIEHAVPKRRLRGAFFDTRVVTIGGDPVFTVVRQNRHPITNLHLGGWRGQIEDFHAEVPLRTREAAMKSCRTIAASHDALQIGIDVMYEAGAGGHRVLEANAFGDLLPNLERDGLTVYGWQIQAMERRWAARSD